MSQSGAKDTDEQTQHLRKRALRQRAQDFIREDRRRQLKRGQNDRRVKAKAAETRVRPGSNQGRAKKRGAKETDRLHCATGRLRRRLRRRLRGRLSGRHR
jgi:hypothetical protein